MALNLSGLITGAKSIVSDIGNQFSALAQLPAQIQRTNQSIQTAQATKLKLDGLIKTNQSSNQIANTRSSFPIAETTTPFLPSAPSIKNPLSTTEAPQIVSQTYPLNLIYGLGSSLVDAVARANVQAFKDYSYVLKEQGLPSSPIGEKILSSINPKAIGMDKIENTGETLFNEYDKQNKLNPPTKPIEAIRNSLTAVANVIIPRVFDAFMVEGVLKPLADLGLKATYSAEYKQALQRFGLSDGFTREEFKNAFVSAAQGVAQTGDRTMFNNILSATQTIANETKQPQLNAFGKVIQSISETLTKPIQDIGKFIQPFAVPTAGELPGYRSVNPETTPVGLSTNPIEPVGFGEKKPKDLQPLAQEARKILESGGVSPEKTTNIIQKLEGVINKSSLDLEKDIRFIADTANPSTRKAFEKMTGVSLEKTQKGAQQQIRDFIGKEALVKKWLTTGEAKKSIQDNIGKEVVIDDNKRDWIGGRKPRTLNPSLVKLRGIEGNRVIYTRDGHEFSKHIDTVRDIIVDGKSQIGDVGNEKYASSLFPKSQLTDFYNQAVGADIEETKIQKYIKQNIDPDVAKLFVQFDENAIKPNGDFPLSPEANSVIKNNVRIKTLSENSKEPYLASFEKKSGKDLIENVNASKGDIFHEDIHAWVANTPDFNKFYKDFQQSFDSLKQSEPKLQLIEDILKTDKKNYSSFNSKDLTEERFAYVGEMFGGGGIDAIPESLKPYYDNLLSATKGVSEPPIKRPPSLEKLGLREKPNLITRREDVLLRARIRSEARGAKVGILEGKRLTREELITKFKSSRETIKGIKKDLIKYIDENLPQEAKGKLTQALVRDNLTRKNAASIFSRVERMKETLTRKELVGEIKELSVPKGNLAVDYQKQVVDVIGGIDLVKPTEATLKKLKGLRDFIQKEGTPLNIQSKHLEKLNRLTKKNVSQLSTAELAELKDTLTQLQKLGELKQDLKYKYNERERKIALDRLLASTQNIDPKVSGNQTKIDTYKVGAKKAYMDTLHTPRVADMIDGFNGYQGENAKYIKQLGAKETTAKENTRAIVNSALEEIQNLGVEELTAEQQIRMMINIRHREGAFDQVKTLMEKNGLKEIPKLTDQENKIIEILKKYTNQHTDDIAAVFEEIENQPFHKLKEYVLPIKYEKEFNLVPSQTIEQGRFRTTQTFKGFTYERQKGVEKTPRTDILAIFEEAINSQQWYLNMQPELENIKYLVKSEEYLAKGGEMASNWWRNELDIVARRGWSATAHSNPILRQGRINLNQAILGYKISSILMQPFAVFDAMAYAQSRYGTMAVLEIIKEFSKAWIIPKYAKNIIAESPVLQQRQAGELAIEETLKKVGKTKGLVNGFIRGGMSLLQKADVRTAAGIQQGLENILIKYGISNPKGESEFLMNLVSGSNEVSYRPHILASGEGARTWFTFQTFFLNRWGILIHDLIKSGVIKGGGETGWSGLWKRMSALIGLGIFIAGSIAENQSRKAIYETTTGKKLPNQSTAKTAMMFIPEQVPYFGNLIEAADRGGDANPPVIRTLENIFSGGASAIKGKTTKTQIKGGLKAVEAGVTLGVGIPGTAQFFDLMERIFLGGKETSSLQSNYGSSKSGQSSYK